MMFDSGVRASYQKIISLLRLKRPTAAVSVLDRLLLEQRELLGADQPVQTLEYFVSQFPQAIEVRERLIQQYLKQGRKDAALRQLDILGEIQLDAGMFGEAAQTIQRILALTDPHEPPDILA